MSSPDGQTARFARPGLDTAVCRVAQAGSGWGWVNTGFWCDFRSQALPGQTAGQELRALERGAVGLFRTCVCHGHLACVAIQPKYQLGFFPDIRRHLEVQ